MRRTVLAMLVVLMMSGVVFSAEDVARPEKVASDRPAVWKGVPANQRLAAIRVAEEDAQAQLAQRIYGLSLAGGTRVLDFVLASDDVKASLDQRIKGVKTTEVTYTEDLIVEVVCKVTIREIVETIKKTVVRHKLGGKVNEQALTEISRETLDTVVAALGNGAVPGSRGHKMIMAKRAAEADAYRKLAETIFGARVKRWTQVSKLMLERDEIASRVAACLKGAKSTKIVYDEDGSCSVTMQITIRDVVQTVTRSVERYVKDGKVMKTVRNEVKTENMDKVIEVTGRGAPRVAVVKEVAPEGSKDEAFYKEVQIIRRVIKKEVGAL